VQTEHVIVQYVHVHSCWLML